MAIVNGVEVGGDEKKNRHHNQKSTSSHNCYDLGETLEQKDKNEETPVMGMTGEISAESVLRSAEGKDKAAAGKKRRSFILSCVLLIVMTLASNFASYLKSDNFLNIGKKDFSARLEEAVKDKNFTTGKISYCAEDGSVIIINFINDEKECKAYIETILDCFGATYTDKDMFDEFMNDTFDYIKEETSFDAPFRVVLQNLDRHGCQCSEIPSTAEFGIEYNNEWKDYKISYAKEN